MDNRPLRTLGDLVTLQRGIDLPSKRRVDGQIPIMGSFGITGFHNEAACKGPGVIVGRSGGSIGVVSYIAEDYWPLNTCLYVKDFHGNNPRFVYYYLQTIDLARLNSGSAQPSLNRNFVHPNPARFPNRPGQDDIAELLGSIDSKIELNRQMNETLEASARALFRDWFVDLGPTKAKMAGDAPYLASDLWPLFPAQLDDAGVPEGWQISTIGKEVNAVGGSTPSTKNEAFWNGNVAWTTPKDLSGLQSPALLETARSISEAGLAKISSGLLPTGTVLLSSRAPVGYLAITQIPMAVNQGYIAMKCEGRLSNCFVYLWAKENRALISQNANGSTFQEISKKNFRPLPILVPDTDTRDVFDSLVKPLFDRIVANEREIRTLAQTRDLLLPKLMSGEIRVGEAEKTVSETA